MASEEQNQVMLWLLACTPAQMVRLFWNEEACRRHRARGVSSRAKGETSAGSRAAENQIERWEREKLFSSVLYEVLCFYALIHVVLIKKS